MKRHRPDIENLQQCVACEQPWPCPQAVLPEDDFVDEVEARLIAADRDAWRLIFAAYSGQKIKLTTDIDSVMAAVEARLRRSYEH